MEKIKILLVSYIKALENNNIALIEQYSNALVKLIKKNKENFLPNVKIAFPDIYSKLKELLKFGAVKQFDTDIEKNLSQYKIENSILKPFAKLEKEGFITQDEKWSIYVELLEKVKKYLHSLALDPTKNIEVENLRKIASKLTTGQISSYLERKMGTQAFEKLNRDMKIASAHEIETLYELYERLNKFNDEIQLNKGRAVQVSAEAVEQLVDDLRDQGYRDAALDVFNTAAQIQSSNSEDDLVTIKPGRLLRGTGNKDILALMLNQIGAKIKLLETKKPSEKTISRNSSSSYERDKTIDSILNRL